ncbi:cysteine-rich receptor-like protein kinase, partial [Trifolium medium]|nr:cysteine-rich receptor-like protein kinase [Trifolium medium]
MWNNIVMSKAGFGCGNWCVMGDFNAVREPNDRRGVNGVLSSNMEMRDFGGFIEDLELVDLPLLGRRFTWYHANGIAMSRIDRILVSSEWLEAWGDISVWVCSRDVSDHCPLVVKIANNEWGPKPFRFNNNWIDHKHFKKVVEESWRGMEVSGWMSFVFKEKLRGLKGRLKEWNMVEFGSLESRMKNLVEDIRELDVKGEIMGLDSNEVVLRKEFFVELWKLQKHKEAVLFQRSRSNWLRQGDANSSFFHNSVRVRAKWNAILALKVDNMWIESPLLIREAVVNYFKNHFEASATIRPKLDEVPFSLLSEEENCALTATFSLEEIQKVVMESDGNKSPGPDGFNFTFLKSCWDIIKGEIRVMFDQFHGRNLVDGVMVVNEVVDSAKRLGKECLIFKVDFEKAYDSVDWGFLEYMLRRFGFCDVWIGWIRACVFGGNLSVLVNGSPTGEINIQRGLKQGDPLAPFLFLLVAEGFGGVMRRAGELHLFKGFKVQNEGPMISHLQYADDTLCIGEASVDNLWTLKAI